MTQCGSDYKLNGNMVCVCSEGVQGTFNGLRELIARFVGINSVNLRNSMRSTTGSESISSPEMNVWGKFL